MKGLKLIDMRRIIEFLNSKKSMVLESFNISDVWKYNLLILFMYGMMVSLLKPELIPALSVYEDNIFLSSINNISHYLSMIVLILSLFLFMLYGKFDEFNLIFILMQLYLFTINLLNNTLSAYVVYNYQSIILVLGGNILINVELFETILKKVTKILGYYLFINLFLRLFFHKGLYVSEHGHWGNWLFGNYMLNYYYYLTAFLLSKILVELNPRYRKDYRILVIIILISIFLFNSTTSLFSILFLWLYYLVAREVALKYKINYFDIFAFSLFILFILQMLLLSDSFLLKEIISLITKKSSTFSGRTEVWKKSIQIIKNNFIFGMGYEQSLETIVKVGFANMHNHLLNVLYLGGIIFVIFQAFLLAVSVKSMKVFGKEFKYYDINTTEKNIEFFIYSIYLSLSLYLIFETRRNFLFVYVILFFMYYVQDVINDERIRS